MVWWFPDPLYISARNCEYLKWRWTINWRSTTITHELTRRATTTCTPYATSVRWSPKKVANTIACSIVWPRLDYCNGILYEIIETNWNQLQRIQNALARIVSSTLYWSFATCLALHWLPLREWITYKIATTTFKVHNNLRTYRNWYPLTYHRDCSDFLARIYWSSLRPKLCLLQELSGSRLRPSGTTSHPVPDLRYPSSHFVVDSRLMCSIAHWFTDRAYNSSSESTSRI